MGRPFCENFLILVTCPRDPRKKSDWFRCKKISQKLKYLNFKCEQSERYLFVLFYSFHHSVHVPCEKIRWRQAKSVSGNQALECIIRTTDLIETVRIFSKWWPKQPGSWLAEKWIVDLKLKSFFQVWTVPVKLNFYIVSEVCKQKQKFTGARLEEFQSVWKVSIIAHAYNRKKRNLTKIVN